jgi:hypothetical protein
MFVRDPQTIDQLIGFSSHCGDEWHIPLFRAARDGRICLVAPTRDAAITTKDLNRATDKGRRPAVILLQEDDGTMIGPDGWRCAKRVRAWAASAIVHACGGLPEHYEMAVSAAVITKRLLLIETDTAHGNAWAEFVIAQPGLSALHIRVRDGEPPHPTQPVLQ